MPRHYGLRGLGFKRRKGKKRLDIVLLTSLRACVHNCVRHNHIAAWGLLVHEIEILPSPRNFFFVEKTAPTLQVGFYSNLHHSSPKTVLV